MTSHDIITVLQRVRQLGFRRFRLESSELVLEVDTESAPRPESVSVSAQRRSAPSSTPRAAAKPGNAVPSDSTLVSVRAPMSGTFYRAPAPNAPPFVEVGTRVRASDTVCIIEVMKLFNTITAGVDGVVAEIVAENEQPVLTDQPVIWIKPG